MPKGRNQKLKLYRLYKIMLRDTDEDHALTLKQIQERLAECDVTVDRKTLYNDFNALEEFGLDIKMTRDGNEYSYRVVSKEFELAELKLLVDAIQASKFITARKSKQLISKLTNFASSYEARQLNRQVIVSGRIKTMNESIYYNVDSIHRAIAENKQIRFEYLQWNLEKKLVPRKDKPYQISPWALTWDGGNYYLIAYEAETGMMKNYRVDKMDKIKVLDQMRKGKSFFDKIDMATFTKENFGMFSGKEKKITLRFSDELTGVMIDRFGSDIPIHKVDKNHSETVVPVSVSNMFFGWISGLGEGVQIMKPAEIREQYVQKMQKMIAKYQP